ncbi:PREDICTED: thrombospondin type-1 domain-containing protein 4-like [Acropora digitifera]|uniref:thrombospondin type-1 domain-containing protein 4-like n=1 Tax=Acropora digitifera TaxID=70779 RepID=UPI00077AD2CA|nr:PREDICTED: thrombospondin type-1 domain-containing protein 4-like [Acropora digitifera]
MAGKFESIIDRTRLLASLRDRGIFQIHSGCAVKSVFCCVTVSRPKRPKTDLKLLFLVKDGDSNRSFMALTLWTILLLFIPQCFSQSFQWRRSPQADRWGAWSVWGPCSRSCGGGTTIRTRQCFVSSRTPSPPRYVLEVYRQNSQRRGNCHGTTTQYGTCNTQDCYKRPIVTRKMAIQARAVQCSKFNNVSFNGYFFTWMPFLRAKTIHKDECQLNCLAKGHMFFLRLSPKVKDGTPCFTDLKKVCIDGKCQNGYSLNDDKKSCDGTYDDLSPSLPVGYNPVITIPAGATKINVTEIRRSKNFLALKSHESTKYYINGNWVIDLPKGYTVAGTTFYYSRPRRSNEKEESLIADGPTTEDLDIMLLYQDDEPRIMYSYFLPKNMLSTQKKNRLQPAEPAPVGSRGLYVQQPTQPTPSGPTYAWKLTGFSQCSHSCAGGGSLVLGVDVQGHVELVYKSEAFYANNLSIVTEEDTIDCCQSATVVSGEDPPLAAAVIYSGALYQPIGQSCSVTCEKGHKQRIVRCLNINNQPVNERLCRQSPKPPVTVSCFTGSCKTEWFTSHKWSKECYKRPIVTRKMAIQARAVQCSKFNNVSFNGYFFTWMPFLRAKTIHKDECQLNCLAKGHMFFLRLSPKVKDGTPCFTDLKKVCIDGKCQELPPECKNGGCFVSKPTVAPKQRWSGLFTYKDVPRGRLVLGYNPVITIPAGATKINVTEIRRSKNFLALKSHESTKYYINGNWVIDLPKGYTVAGTTFYYSRPRRSNEKEESLIADGPTTEDLDIMLLYQDDEPKIMYSYFLPKNMLSTQKKNRLQPAEPAPVGSRGLHVHPTQPTPSGPTYTWKLTGFSQCSHSCAGGIFFPTINCIVSSADNTVVVESSCARDSKPATRQRVCNLQPCAPRWEPGAWGRCSRTCEGGLQIRSLLCKQLVDSNGRRHHRLLPISYCRQWGRPAASRSCNLQRCPLPANWTVGEWSECSVTCEKGHKQRIVRCVNINNQPVNERLCRQSPKPPVTVSCFTGSCKTEWFTSHKWSKCSVPCGKGQQSRAVFCGRKGGHTLTSTHCSQSKKPGSTRSCNSGKCQAKWVATEWSECSVDCGKGTQVRTVFCAGKVGGKFQELPDHACLRTSKPITSKLCGNNSCQPQWFTSQWGECSRSCNGGSQTRSVMCFDHKGQTSRYCSSKDKPFHYQHCNSKPCPTSRGRVAQFKPCNDIYSHGICFYVTQANFCRYSHYNHMCCNSCQRRRH